MTAKAKKIISLLSDLSVAELSEVNKTLCAISKAKQSIENQSVKAAFSVGDQVWFTASRTGKVVEGKVIKIMRKNIQLQTAKGMQWRVTPSLLTKA